MMMSGLVDCTVSFDIDIVHVSSGRFSSTGALRISFRAGSFNPVTLASLVFSFRLYIGLGLGLGLGLSEK